MLNFVPAQQRDINSLQNWVNGTGYLAREETAYLTHHHELVSLAPGGDSAIVKLEAWVEDKFIQLWRDFRKVRERHKELRPADNRIEPFAQCLERSERIYLFRPVDSTNRQGAPVTLDNASANAASHHLQHRQ